jgi:hypothetical protein
MFSQKLITASFNIGGGSQGSGNQGSITLSGLRMTCDYHVAGGDGQPFLDSLVIYGMTLDQMNQLSVTGMTYNKVSQNTVTIQAGSQQEGMSTVFTGDIIFAWPDGSDQPNVRFNVVAKPGAVASRKPLAPTTRKGAVDGSTLVQQLAQQMGFRFENNGVNTQIRNPYLHGTGMSQVRQIIDAMSCQWVLDRGTLAIWPTGKARSGSAVLISPQTGMVGYPQFDQARIRVTSYYNPAITPMSQIQVQSSFTAACGVWNIGQIDYELDCLVPHGRWFMTMMCNNPGGGGLPSGTAP